jgi:ABC-type polysaccharide/polyol phosphate transport system ATPase subunit
VARIEIRNVDLEFPVYDVSGRSLRRKLLNLGIGAPIREEANNRIIIKALEDISCSIRDGDRVGLVGHNGAGKSTLLRAMAGIYEPVRGEIEVTGNIAPLFDLTFGMDADATGYENIFLQGMVIGLTEPQIRASVDDIAEFTELGDFLDLPIRTYSSGMLMRLAFGIVTSSVPEIILIDEVIGAGDRRFFERARRRLTAFSSSASILVIASHAKEVIESLCEKAILLDRGKLVMFGSVEDVFQTYKEMMNRK